MFRSSLLRSTMKQAIMLIPYPNFRKSRMYNPADSESETDTNPAEKESETETSLPENPSVSKQKSLKCTKRRYECDECEYSTNDKKTLKRHVIRKHTGNLPYKCEHSDCNFCAMKPSGLREHMKIHAKRQEHECDMCDYRTNLKSSLSQHKKKKHFQGMSDEDLQAIVQRYKCSGCEYTCANPSNLEEHQSTHLPKDNKPFKCEKCSYSSSRRDLLAKHVASKHDGTVPVLTCDKCDFTAGTKFTINKHVAKCKGEHPYTCNKCDYKTAVLKNLFSHAETHVNSV